MVKNITATSFDLTWDHHFRENLQFMVQIAEVSQSNCIPDLSPSLENMYFRTVYHGSNRSFQGKYENFDHMDEFDRIKSLVLMQ